MGEGAAATVVAVGAGVLDATALTTVAWVSGVGDEGGLVGKETGVSVTGAVLVGVGVRLGVGVGVGV